MLNASIFMRYYAGVITVSVLGLSCCSFRVRALRCSTGIIPPNNRAVSLSAACLFAHRMPQLSPEEDASRIRRNLELRWKLMQSNEECELEDMYSCGGPCDVCQEEGTVECRFCQGTGFLTVGETIYSGKDCPVCSGLGEEECKNCMGRKWVARWRTIEPGLLAGDNAKL